MKTEVGHVIPIGGKRNDYRVFVKKTGRKKPLGSPRRRWESNNTTDIEETRWREWIEFIWLAVGVKGRHL
jgi:hypothetical protein